MRWWWVAVWATTWQLDNGQHLVQKPVKAHVVHQPVQLVKSDKCPDLVGKVFESSVPEGGINNKTMNYTKMAVADKSECVRKCCDNVSCQAVFMFQNGTLDCFFLSCASDQLCLPKDVSQNKKYRDRASLVLVRPKVSPWTLPPSLTTPKQVCEVGVDDTCGNNKNLTCVAVQDKSRNGVCVCVKGLVFDVSRTHCVVPQPVSTPATTTVRVTPITVSVVSKTVTLPKNKEHLAAYTVPQATEENPYKYDWKLIAGKDLAGEVSNSASPTLELAGLQEGVYQFKVTVTSSTGYGEAVANVTVLAEKHINAPPVAIVAPLTQTVNLPTNKAIIDGSTSTDDSGKIASYTWEMVKIPIGYEHTLKQEPTLSLDKLIEGNYTVKLTVKDSEGLSSEAVATIIVLKETDYPPKANAGEDVIVYLPTNSVTLNGNKSLDDHDITIWEWTKEKIDGLELPADIVGSKSPYLTASNLQLGVYNFRLRVTDIAGQSDEDHVAVYVKPPTNLAPTVKAGANQTVSIPVAFITLDGSASTDDVSIVSYNWTVQSGPGGAVIASPSQAVTNVTNLTVGKYTFLLVAKDGNNNTGSDRVVVTVKQDTNAAPVANAGGDRKVTLPVGVVRLDGRGSSDDLGVEKWAWSRGPASLAAGTMVGNSSVTPVLVLSGLVPGRYVFILQVWDVQGKTDTDSVSIIVEQDPELLSVVELGLGVGISSLTYKQVTDVLERIRVLVHGEGEVTVLKQRLYGAANTNLATLWFKVLDKPSAIAETKAVAGLSVVNQLRRELEADPELLGLSLVKLDTLVCQNKCSGHGVCDQTTRLCVCQPFWMENVLAVWLLGSGPNCDWSVVYVCLTLGIALVVLLSICCVFNCRKKVSKRVKSPRRYARLGTTDTAMEMEDEYQTSLIHSETDSDEEVLFESNKKVRRLNGAVSRATNKNGAVLRNGKKTSLKAGGKLVT